MNYIGGRRLYEKSHLRVLESELLRELLAVRLGYVLLQLEPLLESAPLQVGEDGPAHHTATGLAPGAARPREAQAHARQLAQARLHRPREASRSAAAQLLVAAARSRNYATHKSSFSRLNP